MNKPSPKAFFIEDIGVVIGRINEINRKAMTT
jgi:hypothetical protein